MFFCFWIRNTRGSNTCVRCARRVHFYYGFIMILDAKPFWSLRATRRRFCVLVLKDVIVFLPFLESQIAISLGLDRDLVHFLETFWEVLCYDFASVKIMTMFCYSLPSQMLRNSFWRPCVFSGLLEGLLVVFGSRLVWGCFFIVLAGIQTMTIFS